MSNTLYYAIWMPEGEGSRINFTTLALSPEDAIKEFMEQEQTVNWVANMGRRERGEGERSTPSWEGFEAQGYKVVPCRIVMEKSP